MTSPHALSRQAYHAWVEDQIEDVKAALTRDELLELADQAVRRMNATPDGQYPLTEILLRDVVDSLLFEKLSLPDYRQWRRACQNDTVRRPLQGTPLAVRAAI